MTIPDHESLVCQLAVRKKKSHAHKGTKQDLNPFIVKQTNVDALLVDASTNFI